MPINEAKSVLSASQRSPDGGGVKTLTKVSTCTKFSTLNSSSKCGGQTCVFKGASWPGWQTSSLAMVAPELAKLRLYIDVSLKVFVR